VFIKSTRARARARPENTREHPFGVDFVEGKKAKKKKKSEKKRKKDRFSIIAAETRPERSAGR
jgi:hypothetical protein